MTVDNSPLAPLYSIIVVLWAFAFAKGWSRKNVELGHEWNAPIDGSSTAAEVRPAFYGKLQTSPITGQPELHYSAWKRRCKYAVSAVVTLFMLAVAFVVMICSLNLQGYIPAADRFGVDNPFHVPELYQFSKAGAIFDPNGPLLLSLLPVVAHSMVILILNQFIYRRIAEALNHWENHRTVDDFESALVLKRFFFEAFDCYIALFYLCFWECDVLRLQGEMQALFATDCLRRVLMETLVPLVMHATSQGIAENKKHDDPVPEPKMETVGSLSRSRAVQSLSKAAGAIRAAAENDDMMEQYEQFDDYLEMTIQFGYVVLFASAMPLAAVLSIINNVVELRSDATKLSFVSRRPPVSRTASIGMWQNLVIGMAALSALTNSFIVAFTSEQMMQWVPDLFKHHRLDASVEQVVLQGSGRYVVGLVFGLEHALLLSGLLIWFGIKNVPKWVRLEVDRRNFRNDQTMAEIQRQERKRRRALREQR